MHAGPSCRSCTDDATLRTYLHAPTRAGGDGPKRRLLEAMVQDHGLQGRVALAGAVPQEHARAFLVSARLASLPRDEG